MGLGYEYFIQIKTVIADSHYIYIFFFFSNLFILYYYYSFFFVYGCMGCFGFRFPQHFDDEQQNNVFIYGTQSQKENPFCKSLRKKKTSKKKDHNADYCELFLFHFDISIYLFSWAELFYFPLAVMSDIE